MRPWLRAEAKAGSSKAMRIASMAMTTKSSMRVKAQRNEGIKPDKLKLELQQRRVRRWSSSFSLFCGFDVLLPIFIALVVMVIDARDKSGG